MKLLVTGGAGFIGSHFLRGWLRQHPADMLVNLDSLTYAGSRERVRDVESTGSYQFSHGDICDRDTVRRAMERCDVVVHFAAETHVDRSIADATPFLRTNVEGTYVLLQAAHAAGVKRFLHVSTDEVYGPVLDGAVDESAALSPRSPYAASKAAGDLIAQAFYRTHGLAVIVVRPTNIFGPAQLPEKFIPLCIANSSEGLPVPIYGDGQQQRAWLFVGDLCEAMELIVDRGQVGESYNIAGGNERTNVETARSILSLLGRPTQLLQFVTDRPGHDRRYAMIDTKLRGLGWQPKTSFDDGLTQTVAWYREHHDWWRPLVARLRQDSHHWLDRAAQPEPSAASS